MSGLSANICCCSSEIKHSRTKWKISAMQYTWSKSYSKISQRISVKYTSKKFPLSALNPGQLKKFFQLRVNTIPKYYLVSWPSMTNRRPICFHRRCCLWLWPLNLWPSKFPKCLFWLYLVSLWPWPLTSWSQSLIRSVNIINKLNKLNKEDTKVCDKCRKLIRSSDTGSENSSMKLVLVHCDCS